MLYNLKNPYEAEKYKAAVNNLFRRKVIVEVTEKKPKRSLNQNNYLHLILSYFASQYGCSASEAKLDYYKRTCNKDIFEMNITDKFGNKKTALKSSAVLSSGEMTLSIERFRNWSSAQAGIYLPSADEKEGLLYAEQEVEKNREYVEQLFLED